MPDQFGPSNIDETVRRFIMRYGDQALAEAQQRLAELEHEGDRGGAETWQRVVAAIASTVRNSSSGRVH